jgi:ribosomal protein L40E
MKSVKSICPKCGTENIFDIYKSIDINFNPELYKKITHREINKAICHKCGADGELFESFLLCDNEKNFWVFVYNECFRGQEQDAIKNEEVINEEALRIVGSHACPIFHVFGYDELFVFLKKYHYKI